MRDIARCWAPSCRLAARAAEQLNSDAPARTNGMLPAVPVSGGGSIVSKTTHTTATSAPLAATSSEDAAARVQQHVAAVREALSRWSAGEHARGWFEEEVRREVKVRIAHATAFYHETYGGGLSQPLVAAAAARAAQPLMSYADL